MTGQTELNSSEENRTLEQPGGAGKHSTWSTECLTVLPKIDRLATASSDMITTVAGRSMSILGGYGCRVLRARRFGIKSLGGSPCLSRRMR